MASNPSPQVVQPTYVSPVSPSAAASQSAIISQFGGGGVTGASPTGGTAVTGGVRGEHNTDDPAGLYGAVDRTNVNDPTELSNTMTTIDRAMTHEVSALSPNMPGKVPGLFGLMQNEIRDLYGLEATAGLARNMRAANLSMEEQDQAITAALARRDAEKAMGIRQYGTFKELYDALFGDKTGQAATDFDPATEFDKRDTEGRFDPSNFGPRGLSPENDPGAFGYGPGGGPGPDPTGQGIGAGDPGAGIGGPDPGGGDDGSDPGAGLAKGGLVTRDRVPGKPTPPGVDDGPVNVDVGEYVVPTWFIKKVGGAKKFEEILKKATGLLPRGAPPRKG